ncbi:MAG: methyl-accepting chemotaxis protein [Endozoicomonas sp.]
MKGNPVNREQGSKVNKGTILSITMLIVSLSVMTGAFFYHDQQSQILLAHATSAGELRVLSQQIAKNASEAAAGKEEAFPLLQEATQTFDQFIGELNSAKLSALPFVDISSSEAAQQIKMLNSSWMEMQYEAQNILTAQNKILSLHDVANMLGETIPQLQIEYDEIVEILLENNASADQISLAQKQPWLAERIIRSVAKILEGSEDSIMAADSFSRDVKLFERVLDGMIEGNITMRINQVTDNEAIDRLLEIADLFEFVNSSVDEILEASPELFQVRAAADIIFTDSQQLLQQTSVLADTLSVSTTEKSTLEMITLISGGLSLLFILSTAISIIMDTSRRLKETKAQSEETEAQNAANQKAILRLLDEMADLADGDLTVKASVTEDFTGAIADSINFSIEQLRELVNTVNQTAVQVDTAAQETQSTAHLLAQASDHQAQEIGSTTRAVNEMAESIDRVSGEASDSAEVAERSVHIAANGGLIVRNTIDGMSTIREQIQDTSKRLKRLGESSQEIGEIISLINEIADQTNILSLNAAIQASMAGETGRGFAMVADEVQRLAERVSSSTKQVEGLVSAIQMDTHEAVTSMEHTTSEVVQGVHLAQDAGVALKEIQQVSNNLAGLIRNISKTAKAQSQSASQISIRMVAIRDTSIQTSTGTKATAQSIGQLADMAMEMRQSVTGFKLPEVTEV